MKMKRVGKYILDERKRQGLRRADLAIRSGSQNVTKSIRRIKDLEEEGVIIPELLKSYSHSLGIEESVMHSLMAQEHLEQERKEFDAWITGRLPLEQVKKALRCGNCPFFRKKYCNHAYMNDGRGREVPVARWVGFVRPKWCPLREDHTKDDRPEAKISRGQAPITVTVDGQEVLGIVIHLSEDSIRVEIRYPYRGLRASMPDKSDLLRVEPQVNYIAYCVDNIITKLGLELAKNLLTRIFESCRTFEAHVEEIRPMYRKYCDHLDRFHKEWKNSSVVNEERRKLLNMLRSGEITNAEFQSRLRDVKNEDAIHQRENYEALNHIKAEYENRILDILGVTDLRRIQYRKLLPDLLHLFFDEKK